MTKVADILKVSQCTIYQRMKEENRVLGSYSSITDTALDTLILSIKRDHPNDGEVLLTVDCQKKTLP